MTPIEYLDRLHRLDRRSKLLFDGLRNFPQEHVQIMQFAWDEARAQAPSERFDVVGSSEAAGFASKLDAILCLLERIVRPSAWIDEQGPWFIRARHCLLDAAVHATQIQGEQRLLPPILVMEPIDSPLYYPRAAGRASFVNPATPADLPLPVIVCPGNILEEPWEWASLLHELGHHLDASRKESAQLRKELFKKERELAILLGAWPEWIQESLADVYAALLGGPGAVETLKSAFANHTHLASSHPPGQARSAVLEATWNSLCDGKSITGTTEIEVVAGILAEHFQPWQSAVRQDVETNSSDLLAPRLVPGKMRQDYQRGAEPGALRESCSNLFANFPPPDWSLPQARMETLSRAMRHLVETWVMPGADPLKVPPAKLLERHDSVSFVGGTHGQLHEQLELALAMRGETRPWRCIEIFALDDASLLRMTLNDKSGRPRSGPELIEERELSLKQIGDYLTTKQIQHHLYIYNDPYLAASYWDAENNESRPKDAQPAHIHVSSHLWGMDLRRMPGQDYEAPAGEPLPTPMRQYVDALRNLRQISARR